MGLVKKVVIYFGDFQFLRFATTAKVNKISGAVNYEQVKKKKIAREYLQNNFISWKAAKIW